VKGGDGGTLQPGQCVIEIELVPFGFSSSSLA
jgi:hypothetical protein